MLVLRVVRSERRTSLTVNAGCWHALPMGIHAALMLAPGCSRPKSEPTTSPDAVTDGGGGADLRRAVPAMGGCLLDHGQDARRPDPGILGGRCPIPLLGHAQAGRLWSSPMDRRGGWAGPEAGASLGDVAGACRSGGEDDQGPR